jgi:hypothetical protein
MPPPPTALNVLVPLETWLKAMFTLVSVARAPAGPAP